VVLELLVEHAVEPLRLLEVALLGVGRLALVVLHEVVHLPEHRADAAHLPHQPLGHAVALELVGRQQLAGLLGEVEQDRARLHQAEIVVAIDDRRDAVVRADLEELGLELLVLADVDRMRLVGDADLLQHDGSLAAVGGRPGIKIDHESPLCVAKSAG
jgi:hypothetical protein